LKGESYFSDTDIWSLGLVLIECALGKFPYPFEGDEVQELGFWELMKYITMKDSPKLAADKFSEDFRDFIAITLRK
jgi:serine/threonine protein kinase